MAATVVLYEDTRDPARPFGFHQLVAECVFETVNGERHKFEKLVQHRALKSNSKVLASIRRDLPKYVPPDGRVLVVLDSDRVRRLVGLPATATDAEVIQIVKTGCGEFASAVSVCLLERNLETVIEAFRDCLAHGGHGFDAMQFDSAINKKNTAARDALLYKCAKDKAMRDCVRERVPSFRSIVATLAGLVIGDPALAATAH